LVGERFVLKIHQNIVLTYKVLDGGATFDAMVCVAHPPSHHTLGSANTNQTVRPSVNCSTDYSSTFLAAEPSIWNG